MVSYGGKTSPRWRTAASLKIDISPYLSEKSSDFDEFCKQQQILNWMNVTWSKMKKLHWTDSEFDRTHFLFVLISSTTASDWGLSMASHRSCLRRTPRPSSICYVLGAVDICSVGNALCCVLCPEDKLLMSSLRVARSCLLFFFSVWFEDIRLYRRRWHPSAWIFAQWYISVSDRSSPLWGHCPRTPGDSPKSKI